MSHPVWGILFLSEQLFGGGLRAAGLGVEPKLPGADSDGPFSVVQPLALKDL